MITVLSLYCHIIRQKSLIVFLSGPVVRIANNIMMISSGINLLPCAAIYALGLLYPYKDKNNNSNTVENIT